MVTKTALIILMKLTVLQCLVNVTAVNFSVRTVPVFMAAGFVMAIRTAKTSQTSLTALLQAPVLPRVNAMAINAVSCNRRISYFWL